jgi:hypothetical protein
MRHVAAKSEQCLATEEQKQNDLKSVKNILSVQTMMKTCVKNVITGGEKWAYGYEYSDASSNYQTA